MKNLLNPFLEFVIMVTNAVQILDEQKLYSEFNGLIYLVKREAYHIVIC
jgi:hypothetical protein